MKNNKLLLIKKHWILLLFSCIFTLYVLPTCFQNNDHIGIVSAEHVDSGSILNSIIQMNSTSTSESFYNQNIPYHTGYYGYAYNSIIFWSIKFTKIFANSYIDQNFYIFPLIARLLNFIFGLLSIIYLYILSNKILKYNLSKILLFTLFLIFPEYLHYTFHIKSDILGLLFSIVSLNYLYNYLQKPKIIKNTIKANIYGGLSVLCKQPHIFIIFPLLLGTIYPLKGNLYSKILSLLKIYLYAGVLFLFLFFIIHPYAFLEPTEFIARQISMTEMTSSSYIDNVSYWISIYIGSTLMFITAFTPIIFITLNLSKKFRNKTTLFLSFVSIYLITYLLWLTLKVGPMRFIHYLIPILPFSSLLLSYIFDLSFIRIINSKNKKINIMFLFLTIILFLISIKTIKNTIPKTNSIIQSAYNFQKTKTYLSTKIFEDKFINQQLNNKTIIYSISLPINTSLYQKADNTWQGLTKSDYLFIDFTVSWEKPYKYWKNIAKNNGLNREMLFIEKAEKEKNIVLFY